MYTQLHKPQLGIDRESAGSGLAEMLRIANGDYDFFDPMYLHPPFQDN